MGFLNLVQKHHAVGLAPHSLRQLAALLVAHIARGCTQQAGDGVLFHVFAHIDADHGIFVPEHGIGQGLAQLRLAHTGGSQEKEGPYGPSGILKSCPGPADGSGHGTHGFLLSDEPAMQRFLQMQQLIRFRLGHALGRDAGPAGHDLGHVFFRDLIPGPLLLFRPGTALFFDFMPEFPLLVPEAGCLLKVLMGNGILLFRHQGIQLLFLGLHIRRCRVGGDTDPAACLVHQVDGLVRQEPVLDVAVRQVNRRLNGIVGDMQLVMGLIPVPEPPENLNGFLLGGFPHLHRLESSLQSRILFNMLAVFIQCGGADALDLTPGQGRLENVGRVQAALRSACSHNGMHFVDKQDNVL